MRTLYKKARKVVQSNKAAVGSVLATVAGFASAADDYSVIGSAVAIGGVVTAIIGMGVIKIGPNVARWASNKLANFF